MISQENLYQPDKYKVLLGEGSSVGFCTLWNDPEKAMKENAGLGKKSAILGTLYSRQGVNVILRNLALNPQIRKLYLWERGTLSCSPFGVTGKEILEKIWEGGGVSPEREVKGLNFKVEKEIDPDAVNKIVKSVEMVKLGEVPLDAAVATLRDDKAEPYMGAVRFPDAVPEQVDTFPSEEVGWLVRDKYIVDAWIRVLERVMRYGAIKGTQYGLRQRELVGVTWVTTHEDPVHPKLDKDWPLDLRKTVGLTKESLDEYHSIFLSPDLPEGVKYTYGNRLMNYPSGQGTINQIAEVILAQLRNSLDSRRAVATTMVPLIDKPSGKDMKEPPCITQVQAIQAKGNMHFLVTARSNDIFKAAIPNAFGLRLLQKTIADELNLQLGALQFTAQSAHVYEADWGDAKKLVQCAIWDREPNFVFDPESEGDQRGMVLIKVHNKNIVATLQSANGEELMTLEGKTAIEVGRKIAHQDVLSRSDHLLDVGMELQKAELALAHNIQYMQDQPLKLSLAVADISGGEAQTAENVCGPDGVCTPESNVCAPGEDGVVCA